MWFHPRLATFLRLLQRRRRGSGSAVAGGAADTGRSRTCDWVGTRYDLSLARRIHKRRTNQLRCDSDTVVGDQEASHRRLRQARAKPSCAGGDRPSAFDVSVLGETNCFRCREVAHFHRDWRRGFNCRRLTRDADILHRIGKGIHYTDGRRRVIDEAGGTDR